MELCHVGPLQEMRPGEASWSKAKAELDSGPWTASKVPTATILFQQRQRVQAGHSHSSYRLLMDYSLSKIPVPPLWLQDL